MQFEKIKLKCCKAQFFPRFPKEDDSGLGKKKLNDKHAKRLNQGNYKFKIQKKGWSKQWKTTKHKRHTYKSNEKS